MKQLLMISATAIALSSCTVDKGEMEMPITTFTCTGTAQARIVQVKDDFFDPAILDACVGDTIRWIYAGNNPHTTTSTNIPAGASSWNIVMGSAGVTTYSYVVDTTGTYDYECIYHAPGMVGKIIVH